MSYSFEECGKCHEMEYDLFQGVCHKCGKDGFSQMAADIASIPTKDEFDDIKKNFACMFDRKESGNKDCRLLVRSKIRRK